MIEAASKEVAEPGILVHQLSDGEAARWPGQVSIFHEDILRVLREFVGIDDEGELVREDDKGPGRRILVMVQKSRTTRSTTFDRANPNWWRCYYIKMNPLRASAFETFLRASFRLSQERLRQPRQQQLESERWVTIALEPLN